MKFAYARVFTRKQSRDGKGLDEQIAKLTSGFDELIVETKNLNRCRVSTKSAYLLS